jgi:hypothetical protein
MLYWRENERVSVCVCVNECVRVLERENETRIFMLNTHTHTDCTWIAMDRRDPMRAPELESDDGSMLSASPAPLCVCVCVFLCTI